MFKKIAAIAVVGTAMAGLAAPAQAHYVYTLSGWLYHSVQCNGTLKSVPSPDSHPAVVQCVVGGPGQIISVDVLCVNPNSHDVRPGNSAFRAQFVGWDRLDLTQFDKAKGRAYPVVSVDGIDEALLAIAQGDPGQYCVNANWAPVDVLIRQFPTQMTTWICTAKDISTCDPQLIGTDLQLWVPASSSKATCTLPAEFGFNNPPIPGVTPFDCPNPVVSHLL